jgi:hypothetical protein
LSGILERGLVDSGTGEPTAERGARRRRTLAVTPEGAREFGRHSNHLLAVALANRTWKEMEVRPISANDDCFSLHPGFSVDPFRSDA